MATNRICWVDYKPQSEDGVHRVSLMQISEDCVHGIIMYKKEFIKVKLAEVNFSGWND